MNVLLFGATGMVGDGVLHACLDDPRVRRVTAVNRTPLGFSHPKMQEIQRADFFDFSDLADELPETDACFYCIGVTAFRKSEPEYHRLTFDMTLAAGRALAEAHPGAAFCYVSGEGTDSTEQGRSMWARVKGKTENALLALPLNAYMFRPGLIRTRQGKESKTALYRIGYVVIAPIFPLLERAFPNRITSTETMGQAMIAAATTGYPKRILETSDINKLAESAR